MKVKVTHFLAGTLSLGVFLLTGFYLKKIFPAGYEANEIIRYQYRANHIYIFMAGLMNLLAFLAPVHLDRNWRYRVSLFGNILVLAAPLLLITAFFTEPVRAIPQRPLTLFGAITCGAGVAAIVISHLKKETFRQGGV